MMLSENRFGWSLIELLAVITLLSLLMSGAVYTLRTPLAVGRVRGDIDRMLLADRTTRSEARRFHREAFLQFQWKHSGGASLQRLSPHGKSSEPIAVGSLIGVRAAQLEAKSDRFVLPVDASGRSPSYAVKFLNTDTQETWILVAGGTGQPIMGLTAKQVDGILKTLDPVAMPE